MMMTDLQYALRQVRFARGRICANSSPGAADALQRAKDALERCIEEAPALEEAYEEKRNRIEDRREVLRGLDIHPGIEITRASATK